MKAFLSYSLLDTEEFLISLLSSKLRSQGFSLMTGRNPFSLNVDFTTSQIISSSQLFIGIISNKGHTYQRVLEEWRLASNANVPNMLLIEEGVNVASDFKGTYVRFNRHSPQLAIDEINRKMMHPKKVDNEDWGWLIGGTAIIALIYLLSGGGKK